MTSSCCNNCCVLLLGLVPFNAVIALPEALMRLIGFFGVKATAIERDSCRIETGLELAAYLSQKKLSRLLQN